jgi:hypothetical protein
MTIPVSRPRVYLIDFEVTVEFPSNCPPVDCVCAGFPLGVSFSRPEMYSRPPAPEMTTGELYSPFKTDVWQLGTSFADFRVRKFVFHYLFISDRFAGECPPPVLMRF